MSVYLLLVFFCSFLYGLSAVLSKIGLQQKHLESRSLKSILLFLLTNKIWILGLLVSFVANISIVQIQSFIDVSVVYPILNFSYVFVLLLGFFVLDEPLNQRQWLGVFAVIAGTTIILFIDDTATGKGTQIDRLLTISIISLTAIIALIATVYIKKIKNYELFFAACTGIAFGNVETYMKANTNLVNSSFGKFSVVSLDSLAQFVSMWPFLLLVLFGIIGWVCMQITYSHGNVSISVPLFAVIQSSITLGCGHFVFGEAFGLQKTLGILIIVSGVIMLVLSACRMPETETA